MVNNQTVTTVCLLPVIPWPCDLLTLWPVDLCDPRDLLTFDLWTASMLAELLRSFWVLFSSLSWIRLICSSTVWYLLCTSMHFSRSWLHFSLYLSISICRRVFSSSILLLVWNVQNVRQLRKNLPNPSFSERKLSRQNLFASRLIL